ncbi:MAG TPA: ATP-binding protein [Myxococcota bacterium]|nr:ATP-binding protein [Myxococcota bacterium]HOH76563.1 ATP-binding protein [Myxococcota bacterium]HPV05251.1 ATP-binding protein [Myxococcota bacterium]
MYERPILKNLLDRLAEPRRFIQVLAGPRQVGKTTLARQAMAAIGDNVIYASADEPILKGATWVEQQWQIARIRAAGAQTGAVLILDEIQKIPDWSAVVKRLWDQDSADKTQIRLVLLGSSPLLVRQGLSESLAGRFELIPVTHWSWPEMRDAFGWNLETWITFGGYPGAAPLIDTPDRWAAYIMDSLVETSVSRDILQMTRVDKPDLLRRLFDLGCAYSGQVLSYQKMVGQLQDAGNTTTLSHYLTLLEQAGLLRGLNKYAGEKFRQRASSPKLLALNNALVVTARGIRTGAIREDHETWGRLVESAAGAHLSNGPWVAGASALYYWASGDREVDYVLAGSGKIVAFEIKSTRRRAAVPGIDFFEKEFGPVRKILVGGQGLPLEEFFTMEPADWLA